MLEVQKRDSSSEERAARVEEVSEPQCVGNIEAVTRVHYPGDKEENADK